MGIEINSTYDLLREMSAHIKNHVSKHFWVYSGYRKLGSLLIKNMADEKKIIFKPWNTELSIGRTKLKNFIDRNNTFKGHHLDNYLIIGRTFRGNSTRYARSESNITLIEVDFDSKKIGIFGSMNIDPDLSNILIEFFDSIKFESSFDYEGMLHHEGFIGGEQQVKRKEEPIPNPIVFISYSWETEQHKLWVLKLSADLIRSGIKVIIDEWDLIKYQNDLHVFMESGITSADHVIIVCTPSYAQRANDREGGVGVENTIITGEFYDKSAIKYLPIVRGYHNKIIESLPIYLKTKSAIDFKDDSKYDQKFEELLRRILNKPKYKKPELGKIPSLEPDSV